MLENINTGLAKENEKLKREMAKVVKNTKAVHEAREEAMEKMAILKMRIEKMQSTYEQEWANLTGVIADDKHAQVCRWWR